MAGDGDEHVAQPVSGDQVVEKTNRELEQHGFRYGLQSPSRDPQNPQGPRSPQIRHELTHEQKMNLWRAIEPNIRRPDDHFFNFKKQYGFSRLDVVNAFKGTLARDARYKAEDAKRPSIDIDHQARAEARLMTVWDTITRAREGGVLSSAVAGRQLGTARDEKDLAKVRQKVDDMARTAALLDGIRTPSTEAKPGPADERMLRRRDPQVQRQPRDTPRTGEGPTARRKAQTGDGRGVTQRLPEGAAPKEVVTSKGDAGTGARQLSALASTQSERPQTAKPARRESGKDAAGASPGNLPRVGTKRFDAHVEHALDGPHQLGRPPTKEMRTVSRIVDRIMDRAAKLAARDPEFRKHFDSGNITDAGTRFHTIAKEEARKVGRGQVPRGYEVHAEVTKTGPQGESRLDLQIKSPSGLHERDWKTTVKSGLDRKVINPITGEMARHREAVAHQDGKTLQSQESRSWKPAVTREITRLEKAAGNEKARPAEKHAAPEKNAQEGRRSGTQRMEQPKPTPGGARELGSAKTQADPSRTQRLRPEGTGTRPNLQSAVERAYRRADGRKATDSPTNSQRGKVEQPPNSTVPHPERRTQRIHRPRR